MDPLPLVERAALEKIDVEALYYRVSTARAVQYPDFYGTGWDMGPFMFLSGMLKRAACKLSSFVDGLRSLSGGPAGGTGKIRLPPVQPGASFMPGEADPAAAEAVGPAKGFRKMKGFREISDR